MGDITIKQSYTISCSSAFRTAVEALAKKRQVNVADLARSVLLVVPPALIDAQPDPGEPESEDRDTVILKSGDAAGRPWKRKPRLQVRLPPGYEMIQIRKALAMTLAMDQGQLAWQLGAPPIQAVPPPPPPPAADPVPHHEEIEELRTLIGFLVFEPLANGVRNRAEALHVLGFPPHSRPDHRTVRAKFRMLATIHHPDSRYGNHHRMSQLNQAMDVLRREAE